MLFAHPSHPFGTKSRFLHLLATVFAAFFCAAITQTQHGTEEEVHSDAKMKWIIISNVFLCALDVLLREVGSCSCGERR